jgi:hypothetical protein
MIASVGPRQLTEDAAGQGSSTLCLTAQTLSGRAGGFPSRYLKKRYLIRAAMANSSTKPTSRCPRPIPHIMPPSFMAKSLQSNSHTRGCSAVWSLRRSAAHAG